MKLGDAANKGGGWPKPGKHLAKCIGSGRDTAKSGTAYIWLDWETDEGHQFRDKLYATASAAARLAIVAARVCGEGEDLDLPDSEQDRLDVLCEIVERQAPGRLATVEVVEQPDAKTGKLYRRVAFRGYEAAPNEAEPEQRQDPVERKAADADERLPF